MEYQFREIVKRTMSETECAELWYAKALAQGEKTSYSDKYKIKLRVLAYGLSDEPVSYTHLTLPTSDLV